MTTTRIETIGNEVFLEIFNYLDGCDILKAFSNLNIRFQRFITNSSLQLKVKLYSEFQQIRQQFLVPNKHQILSLYLSDHLIINRFLTLFPIGSSFDRLESVNVQFIRTDQLARLLRQLRILPRLFQLIIYPEDDQIDLIRIYPLIFNLPLLKYTKLSSLQVGNLIELSFIPFKRLSPIEYLIIDHPCRGDDIIVILSYAPQLRHLTCRKSLATSLRFFENFLPIVMSNLTHLYIHQCKMEFDDFEIFIKKISSQLQVLKVITFNDPSYLDANRWERLILQNISQLRKFDFEYHEYLDDNYKLTPYHKLSNQFTRPFWTEQQWIFDISISNQEIIYSIRSCRKKLFEFEEYKYYYTQHTNQNIIEDVDPQIPLIVTHPLSEMSDRLFINKIDLILIIFKITHLDVDCSKISIPTLIELIKQLSHLKFLRMSYLPLPKTKYLIDEKRRIIRSSQKHKNITKVNLEHLSQIEQVQFVNYLCPFVQYLIIHCTNDIDPVLLVHCILWTNAKFVKYLILLCLFIPSINDEMIGKLQKMINFEHYNYTIEHVDNKIYLHRKVHCKKLTQVSLEN